MVAYTNVSELGTPEIDGVTGIVRLGTYPDTLDIGLRWNSTAARWVSNPLPNAIEMSDNNLLVKNSTSWGYLGDAATPGQAWSTIRTIPFFNQAYAAGLRLQNRSSGRMHNFSNTAQLQVAPYFYQFNSLDPLVFTNDFAPYPPSPASIGRGVILTQPTIAPDPSVFYHCEAPWEDVNFLQVNNDGSLSSTPVTPSKKFLYPTLYAQNLNGNGVSNGGVAGYLLELRWTS